jgi:hypothetical protein
MLTGGMINQAGFIVTMGCSVEDTRRRPMLAQMQKKKKIIDSALPDPKGEVNRGGAMDQG